MGLPLAASSQMVRFPLAASSQSNETSDLWFFQLQGSVKHIVITGFHRIDASFDRAGHITQMWHDDKRVTVHRNNVGRIDSITSAVGRVDDFTNTKYRQRATDEHGNWIARKTQQKPYIITTEYCHTTYYEERIASK